MTDVLDVEALDDAGRSALERLILTLADTTRMSELIGNTMVPWREGMRRMVESRHPELLPTR